MILSDDLVQTRQGNPDEILVGHDLCTINTAFPHEFTVLWVVLDFTKLFILKLFHLDESKIKWKTIIVLACNFSDCVQLKFAFCELTVILLNPA